MILDTNAVSALQAKDKRLVGVLAEEPVLVLNIISLGEYRYGIDGSRHHTELLNWLDALVVRSEVLAPSLDTISHYSSIRHDLRKAGTPIPANDMWIAALARQHQMPVLSRDAHFDAVSGILRREW